MSSLVLAKLGDGGVDPTRVIWVDGILFLLSMDATYPSYLPGPRTATITSTERRSLSEDGGPRDARAIQLDRLADQRCEFILSATEAGQFDVWWRVNLRRGGSWFASSWPHPQAVTATRKFTAAPSWKLLGIGNWSVTADFEVRGRGQLPA